MSGNFSILVVAFSLMIGMGGFARAQSGARISDRGIAGKAAPAWKTSAWHQLPENKTSLDIGDFKGKVLYLYFFQSWCPGCHRSGFPTLKTLTDSFAGDDSVAFVAIQTTFEGHSVNTAKQLPKMATRYKLKIPIGQSAGISGTPAIMRTYRTGGTPWVVIIDPEGRVRFNDFHIKPEQAKQLITQLKE